MFNQENMKKIGFDATSVTKNHVGSKNREDSGYPLLVPLKWKIKWGSVFAVIILQLNKLEVYFG